jgi:hypothetical protein
VTNTSNIIFPDKDNGVWVDDPNDGLPREPFVKGRDRMSRVVADIPNVDTGFKLTFSARPFPGHGYSWTGCATTAAAIGIDRSNPALSLPGTCGASLHLEQALARRPGSMGHSSNFYRRVRRFGADPQ